MSKRMLIFFWKMKVRLDELAWMTMTMMLLETMRLPLCPVGEQEIVEQGFPREFVTGKLGGIFWLLGGRSLWKQLL